MLALNPFRRDDPGLTDLCPWAALVDDGVVQCKDGSLLVGYYYRGPDIFSSTDELRNELTRQLNQGLAAFGGGWSMWHDSFRRPSMAYVARGASHFPDRVSALIDEERRQQFEAEGARFEGNKVVVFCYTPPYRMKSRVVDMLYSDDPDERKTYADRVLEYLKDKLREFETAVGSVARLTRMVSYIYTDITGDHLRDELVNYLHFTVTGEVKELNIEGPNYLDTILGQQDFWPGDTPLMGNQYVCCLHIGGTPTHSQPQILEVLDHLAMPYRWSTRYIFMDLPEADKQITKYRKKWKQKIRGFFAQLFRREDGPVNEDALLATDEAGKALARTNSGQVATGYYTSVVVFMGPNRAELLNRAQTAAEELRGFTTRIETINTVESFLGTWPGHVHPNVRRPPLHSDNLSHLLPTSSIWTGEENAPCPYYNVGQDKAPPLMYCVAAGSEPFRLNLHVGDTGHTLIIGPTGNGKSTLVNALALQFLRYKGMRIWGFDYKNGMYVPTKACGGHYYDVARGDTRLQFYPLGDLDTADDRMWAEGYIADLFHLQTGRSVTPNQQDSIRATIAGLAAEKAPGMRTMTHFVLECQDQEIRDALTYYTLGGTTGRMLDAEHDSVGYSDFLVFETEELKSMPPKVYIPVLLYLFRRLEKRLDGRPTVVFLAEAWSVFNNPVFAARLEIWLRTFRSKNCIIVMDTQSNGELVGSPLFSLLVESCPTIIFLPNNKAEVEGTDKAPGPRDLYAALGLNDVEIATLQTAQRKRHYYARSSDGSRLFELALGPIGHAIIAASGKPEIERVKVLEAVHNEDWVDVWLAERRALPTSLSNATLTTSPAPVQIPAE